MEVHGVTQHRVSGDSAPVVAYPQDRGPFDAVGLGWLRDALRPTDPSRRSLADLQRVAERLDNALAFLDPFIRTRLCKFAGVDDRSTGEALYHFGDEIYPPAAPARDQVYVLLRGRVQVLTGFDEPMPPTKVELKPGAVLGDVEVLHRPSPQRSSTAVVVTECVFLVFTGSDLQTVLGDMEVIDYLARKAFAQEFVIPGCEGSFPRLAEGIAEKSSSLRVLPGYTFCEEGDDALKVALNYTHGGACMDAEMQWQRLCKKRAPQGITQGSVMSSEESSCLEMRGSLDSLDADSFQGKPGTIPFVDPTPVGGMCFWVMSGEVKLSVTKGGMSKRDKALDWLGRARDQGGHNASQSLSLWDDDGVYQAAPSQPQLVTKCVGTVLHGQPLCGFSSGLSGAHEAVATIAASGAEIFCIEAAVLLTLPGPWPERIRTAWRRVEAHRAKQIGTARHDREDDESQMSIHKPSKRDKGPWTIMKSTWLKRKIFGSETSQRVSWLSKAHKQVSPKYTPADWDKGGNKQKGDESRNHSTSSYKGSHSLLSSDGGRSSRSVHASRLLDICLGEDEQDAQTTARPQGSRHRSQKARKRLGVLTEEDVRPGSGPFFERPISSAGQSFYSPRIDIATSNSQPSARFTASAA